MRTGCDGLPSPVGSPCNPAAGAPGTVTHGLRPAEHAYPEPVPDPSLAALIPVKAFADGKSRLAGELDARQRADLARQLAEGVLAACTAMAPHVVCEDDEVARWAAEHGAAVIRSPGPGLDRAVRHGVAALAGTGYERVLVAHADLADPAGVAELADLDGIVIVPDRHKDGTNVLVVPARLGFGFSYGPSSFARHLSEAERSGLPIHVVDDPGLALDLDDPADLAAYAALADPVPDR